MPITIARVSPLHLIVLIWALVCATTWVASLLSGDTSWVDRAWSIVPVAYVWAFAADARLHDHLLDVMAVLVTLWGARLTFNFARKGGYTGVEDYRWAVLRSRMSPWRFQLFNLFFIVLYQNALLVLITLPAFSAYQHRDGRVGTAAVVLALLFLAALVGETIADQQQWEFQVWKEQEIALGRAPSPRFLQRGLFRYSRHPNYFFELAQWWLVFALGAVGAGSAWQWTVLGPVLLTLLFVGSTNFTESISLSRYPEYAEYQRATSPVIPWFARARPGAESSGPRAARRRRG
jgi:steroid 5-alpha reductase family enzyme